jgi:hypothetical protein
VASGPGFVAGVSSATNSRVFGWYLTTDTLEDLS